MKVIQIAQSIFHRFGFNNRIQESAFFQLFLYYFFRPVNVVSYMELCYTLRNIFGVTLSSNTFWGNYRGRGRKMNFLEEKL